MEPHADLTALALVSTVALLFGLVLMRLKQPAVVGYIAAGIALGPTGLGLVRDGGSVRLLAEMGVLMLVFLVGMELSLRAFKTIWRTALACMLLQVALSIGVALLVGWLLDWSAGEVVLLGFVIAISSTAVAIKILEDIGELRSQVGRVTVGVLIAQDLAVVPMLLILDSFGRGSGIGFDVLARLALAIGLLFVLVRFLSRRERLRLPLGRSLRGRPDIGPLAALAVCFMAATLSGAIGLSSAYGAFIAGLVIGNSTERKPTLHTTRPIESVLLVVFFLSVGLLIDLRFIWTNLQVVAVFLLFVTLIKTALNFGILRLLGQPRETALLSGIAMAQMGEFSFILAGVGLGRGMIDDEGYRLVMAVIALSLVISPLWLATARRLYPVARAGIGGVREAASQAGGSATASDFWPRLKSALQRTGGSAGSWLRR